MPDLLFEVADPLNLQGPFVLADSNVSNRKKFHKVPMLQHTAKLINADKNSLKIARKEPAVARLAAAGENINNHLKLVKLRKIEGLQGAWPENRIAYGEA